MRTGSRSDSTPVPPASSRPNRVRARCAQRGRREIAHRPHGVVELADAGEAGGERDVAERQLGRLDEHPRGLRALRPGQRQRVGPDLGLQQPLELAGGVADAGRQPGDALAVDRAVGDQAHRPATTSPRTFHSGEPGEASGRQRLQARKPACCAAAAVG